MLVLIVNVKYAYQLHEQILIELTLLGIRSERIISRLLGLLRLLRLLGLLGFGRKTGHSRHSRHHRSRSRSRSNFFLFILLFL